MSKAWQAILGLVVILSIFVIALSPDRATDPPVTTRESSVTYSIGEKVKANPYGQWLDGEITAITLEDDYIVKFCGHIGWFNKWECGEKSLKRSELAKVTQSPAELNRLMQQLDEPSSGGSVRPSIVEPSLSLENE